MFILQTTNDMDNDGYAGVNELAGITADKEAVDKNPLFRRAERLIIGLIPDADVRLTGAGQGRNYANRDDVIGALQFIGGAFIIKGAEKVGTSEVTQGTGELKSRTQTIDGVTLTESYDVGASVSRSGGNDIGSADRAAFLLEQGYEILESLGVDISSISDDGVFVVQTDSKLPGNDYYNVWD